MLKDMELFRPEYLIEIIVRRKWYIVIPLSIAMVIGIYFSLTLPKTYRSSTLILVQPQRVPSDFVKSIVTSSVQSRLRTISEQIMSITNVERIIRNFNLFTEPQYKDMYWEDKINQVRQRISLKVSKGHTFSVSFTGKSPRTVMEIANALASYFIDENLKVREAQAVSTSSFLDDELIGVRNKLKVIEKSLIVYRKNHLGSLPEQLSGNLQILEQLRLETSNKELRLSSLQENLLTLETNRKAYLDGERKYQLTDEKNKENIQGENVASLKERYNALRARYTDKHPDIIKMKKMIETMESQTIEKPKTEDSDRILALMDEKRNEMEKQYINIEKKIKEIEHQIVVYQERIEKTPNTEQELVDLNRNYSNIKGQYSSMLSRKLESEIAVNMEKKQKGEQFKIIDPAKMPEKPYEPDLEKLFFLVMVMGLGVGAALIVLMEYFDTAFRRAEEIEPYLKVPVLAYVPKITTKAELRKQRIGRVFGLVPIVGAALLLGLFMITTIKADENTLKIIEKLGILKAIDIFNEFLRAI